MSKDYCSKIIYASTAIFQISGAKGGSNFHGKISPPPSKKKNKNKKTWVPWGNCNYSILIPYFKRNQKLYLDIWLCYVVVGSLGVPGGLCPPPPPSSPFTLANSLQKCVIFSPKKHTPHMGHFPQDGENEQNLSEFFFFEASLWPNGLIFLSFLNCSEDIMSVGV